MNRAINKLLFAVICPACCTSNISASPIGVKLGAVASSFYYTDRVMDPYLDYDIDLRPYLGYDIKWVQLGEQKPLLAPFVSYFFDYKLSNRLFLRPEVGITQKGVVFNQYDYERIIYEVKITYLHIPLTLGFQVVKSDGFIDDVVEKNPDREIK